jgi:sarcosine oxidase delta subunit
MQGEPGDNCTSRLHCEGWWEQAGCGRQPMLDLMIQVAGGRITGSGDDMIGQFTFNGTLSETGHVAMIKQYIGQHKVYYVGSYDGEGTMWGHWRLAFGCGRWLITIRRGRAERAATAAIQELVPVA